MFPPTQYIGDGGSRTYRVRWTLGADGYEAWSEAQGKEGWVTMRRIAMTRSGVDAQ